MSNRRQSVPPLGELVDKAIASLLKEHRELRERMGEDYDRKRETIDAVLCLCGQSWRLWLAESAQFIGSCHRCGRNSRGPRPEFVVRDAQRKGVALDYGKQTDYGKR